MKHRVEKLVLIGFFIITLNACNNNDIKKTEITNPGWEMKLVSGSTIPVIDKNHPGAKDNLDGFENGSTVRLSDGSYHMVITEMFLNGGGEAGSWEPARIAHWKSTDKGNTWTRLSTIVQGTNLPNDPKRNTWSAMWYFDSVENRWNIIWRGYDSVFRYKSDKNGDEGIDSNYSEVSQFIPPLYGARKWWDSQYPASFSNIYKVQDNKYYAFVGNAFRGEGKIAKVDGYWNWYVGLVTAKSIDGPWYRDESKKDPDLIFAENPLVIKEGEIYFAVFDDLLYKHSIGYAYSEDGVNWTQKSLDLTGQVKWCANSQQSSKDNPGGLVRSLRTPCSFIKEGENYVITFSGYNFNSSYFEVGKIIVSINRN